jgi:hypothetical protein
MLDFAKPTADLAAGILRSAYEQIRSKAGVEVARELFRLQVAVFR